MDWKKTGAIVGAFIGAIWSATLFISEQVTQRMSRQDERMQFTREQMVLNTHEIATIKGEIVAIKCRVDPDMCRGK